MSRRELCRRSKKRMYTVSVNSAFPLFYILLLPFLNKGILCYFRCVIGCSICAYSVCSVCKEKWMLTKRGRCQPDGNQKCDTSTFFCLFFTYFIIHSKDKILPKIVLSHLILLFFVCKLTCKNNHLAKKIYVLFLKIRVKHLLIYTILYSIYYKLYVEKFSRIPTQSTFWYLFSHSFMFCKKKYEMTHKALQSIFT